MLKKIETKNKDDLTVTTRNAIEITDRGVNYQKTVLEYSYKR